MTTARPPGAPPPRSRPSLSSVLTDEEAEVIRRKLVEGWRGPVLQHWLEQLLQGRGERREREREGDAEQPMGIEIPLTSWSRIGFGS